MKTLITEIEKNKIRLMHNNQKVFDILLQENSNLFPNKNESIINDWLSPDDRYLILFDELYDLKDKKKLGDVWENFENLKLFLSHSFEVAKNVPLEIKESVKNSLSSLLITESFSDISKIKTIIKTILINEDEGFLDWVGSGIKKTGEWAKEQGKDFVKGTKELFSGGWEMLKKAGISISQGEWMEVLNILKAGFLFIARKIRSLLYNPVGIILDAILIATGVGKGVQWIPWAIVVALDLYEVITGNYEEKDMPTWMRWLMIGTDVLGLVLAGGVAASAKSIFQIFKGVKTEEQFVQIAIKNPNIVKWVEKIVGAFSKVPQLLGKAANYLKNTQLAKGSKFIQDILGRAEGVLKNGAETLSKLSSRAKNASGEAKNIIAKTGKPKTPIKQTVKTALKVGGTQAAVITALDKSIKKGYQLYYGLSDEEVENQENISKTQKNYETESGGETMMDSINKAYE
jgi:hypothetical protein